MPDRFGTDLPCRGDEEAPRPQVRHPGELTELGEQGMGRPALDITHDIRGTVGWQAAQEQVRVVMMTFHGKDLDGMSLAYLRDELFETALDPGDIKDPPAVARAEYEMVVYKRHGRSCTTI